MSKNCICNVPGGSIVVADLEGEEVLCLKTQRQGRDYVHFYLVPLEPAPADPRGLTLIYVDPDHVVTVVEAAGVEIAPVPADEAEVGHVFSNGGGHFLKVNDSAKTERTFAYVDLASGEVRLRQERNIAAVFAWRLVREAEEDDATEFMS